jgi:uncharacterized phage protein (TIGR01671 family)
MTDRVIKYRQLIDGNFHYWGFIDGAFISPITAAGCSIEQAKENSCQFTGLLDRNGKEIYEGDITNYGAVEWCECLNWDLGGSNHPGFYFKQRNEWTNVRGDLDYHKGFDEDIEVIGNIYQNPELLNDR